MFSTRHRKRKFKWIALKLTILIFFIFILQLFFPIITDNFALVSADLVSRPWILLTSIFLHGSIIHLLFNMFALFLFGSILERHIGAFGFIFVFTLTGLGAGLASAFFYPASLGASGAIYGVIGTLAILKPLQPVWAFGVPMPIIIASVLWMLTDFAGFSSYVQGNATGIANAAHLVGIFSGVLLGFIIRNIRKNRFR